MKTNILLTITLVMCNIAMGQMVLPEKPVSHLKELGLKANVQSIYITPYKVVESFGVIEKGDKADFWRGDIISVFDKEGYKTETNYHDKTGKLNQKVIFKYNAKRKRTTRDIYDSHGKIFQKNLYVYDTNGFKIAYNSYNAKGELTNSFTYKNDAKGREIEEVCTRFKNTPCGKYTYSYNNIGKVVELCKYNKQEEQPENCEKYTYDKQGRLLQTDLYKNNTLVQKTIFKYDNLGNEIGQRIFDGNDTFVEEKKFVYKFDQKGNWVERIEYINEFPKLILVREITYH